MNQFEFESRSLKIWRFAIGWWLRLPPDAPWRVYGRRNGLNIRLWRFGITWLNAEAWEDYRDRMRILAEARR